jgi:hypothetical protein
LCGPEKSARRAVQAPDRSSPETFAHTLAVLRRSWRDFGRPCKLCREDQLLLALMHWREYRSLAHIGATYQVGAVTPA